MYRIVYGLLYLFSLLPMRVLHWISGVLGWLLYAVIRYRRDVVMGNLAIAFPERSAAEREKIARDFYRNFTDNFIETIKLLSASEAFMKERLIIDNPEILDQFYDQGRKCQLHLAHTFNWEIAGIVMPLLTRYTFLVAYMPLSNKIFDRLFLHLRSRMGAVMLPATRMQRAIIPYRNVQYLLTLVADQAPGGPHGAYWLEFFGTPTAFIRGPERGARIADIPAVFVRFYKTRRGYYRVFLTTLSDHPASLPEGELTRRYAALLEDTIRQSPDLWLWSHRRWKHQWEEEHRKSWIGEGMKKG